MRGSNFIQLYTNGQFAAQATVNFSQDYGNQPLYFGTSGQPAYDSKLKGKLDEISIYDRALSSTEIAAIYSAGGAGKCKQLAILQQPQSHTDFTGANHKFTVVPTEASALSFQWFHNGVALTNSPRISGASSDVLRLAQMPVEDSGNYWAVIGSGSGTITSAVATLNISVPTCLVNIDFDGAYTSQKTGGAAIMRTTNDHWHPYVFAGENLTSGSYQWALEASGADVGVWLSVPATGYAGTNGSSDPMYNKYVHAPRMHTVWISLTNTIPGLYSIYLYSHDGNFQLFSSDGVYENIRSVDSPVLNPPEWEEGRQYAVYRDVLMTAPARWLMIRISAGQDGLGYAAISGMQIAANLKPWIIQSPTNFTGLEGNNLTLQTSVKSFPAGSLQWYYNGTPILTNARTSGVTSDTFRISGSITNDSGNYWLVASNVNGMVTSEVAVVTLKTNACIGMAGLVGWWTGDGHAFDFASHDDGWLVGGVTYATGKVSGAFSFDGVSGRVQTLSYRYDHITNSYTMEFWAFPFASRSPTFEATTGTTGQAGQRYAINPETYYSGRAGAGVSVGTNGVSVFEIYSPLFPSLLVHNAPIVGWTHIVVVYENRRPKLYVNGELVHTGLQSDWDSFPSAQLGGNSYSGLLDEISIYDRSLSANEVRAIYDASYKGKCRPPLAATIESQNRTNFLGQTLSIAATVAGAAPYAYRWYFNGVPLSDGVRVLGATANKLGITNLSFGDAGNYWLVLSNLETAVTSAVVHLTIQQPVCSPPTNGLVAWWNGDNHTFDLVGTNHGTKVNGVTFAPGFVGATLDFDGISGRVATPAARYINITNTYTMEFWAWPRSERSVTPEMTFYGTGVSGQRYVIFPESAGSAIRGAGVSVGSNGVSVFERDDFYFPSLLVYNAPIYGWTHIAVVYDNRRPKLYVNGVWVQDGLTSSLNSFPSAQFGGSSNGYGFYDGLLDEIGIYNRALSAAEIQVVYNASYLGKCPLPPRVALLPADVWCHLGSNLVLKAVSTSSNPDSYQWFTNGTALTNGGRILGATSDMLTVAGAQISDAANYFVVLTNVAGAATSSVVSVQVGLPPLMIQSPESQTNIVLGTAQFTAQVAGDQPLTYRWYQNATALTNDARRFGATTTNLTITDLVTGDAGNYTLRVTNAYGSITSTVATLTVLVPPSITTQPKGYSVPIGLPVVLAGAASGTAPLRYQWLLNSNAVPNATNNSLTISNLVAGNFGGYQLVVTNGGGAATSAVASLTIGSVATWGTFSLAANIPLWPAAGLSNVIAVAAGSSYSLALRQNGTIHAWGNNLATNVPSGLSGIVGIAGGQSHALALLSNGTVRAWGLGTSGQTNVPVTLSNVIAVAAGNAHSAALRADGTVVVWGGSSLEAQTNMPAGLMKVTSIDAGGSQTLALRADGSLTAWGGRTQYPVPADVKNVTGFSVGPAFSALDLAVLSNGLVRAWGVGQATNVPSGLSGIIAVEGAGGSSQSTGVALALRSNRTVTAWGSSLGGINGLTNVPSGLSNVVALAGGTTHALALVNDGKPMIVRPPVGGTFYSGRDLVLAGSAIGNAPLSFRWLKDGNPVPGGTEESLVIPVAQASDAGSYQLVASNALGVAQSVAVPVLVVDSAPILFSQPVSRFAYYGSPFAVGASVVGSGPMDFTWLQNGVPALSGTNDLVFIRALPQHGGSYQLIASNPFGAVTSSVAQINFSRVASWGSGPSLTNAPVDLGSVLGVASGYFHALAIRSDRTVTAWGTTLNGATNVPVNLNNVVAVAGGSYFSVALKTDGTVVAWGLGTSGQTNVPAGLDNVTSISTGGSHALALRANGTVAAWGLNSSGQTNVPASLSNVVAVAAGSVHSLALKNDGTIVGWGQFGTIPNYTNVLAIAAGFGRSLALRADGTVLAWTTGGGATGLPAGLSNVVAISVGGGLQGWFHSAALKADGTMVAWGNNNAGQTNVPGEVTSAIAISAGGGSTLAYLNDRAPVVAAQPLNRHAASGKNVILAALSVGQPALNFQWRLNGTDIPGAINPTLTLTNVSRNSRGYYSALVWNSLDSTNSREAWLDVVGPVRLFSPTASLSGELLSFVAADSLGGSLTADEVAWLEAQASTNLVNWQTIANALLFTNGALLLQDPAQTNYPSRFYRLIER